MNRILILGVLVILSTTALTISVLGEDKTIDTNEFSFGDEANYANLTTNEVWIGDDHFNNSAKIFVYNNATYDFIKFDIKGDADPVTGEYLSNVDVDLGNNGRPEYRFGGTGVGQWGKQNLIMTGDGQYLYTGSVTPSEEGDLYYIKLPSDAVVRSTSVNLTHEDTPVYKTGRLSSSNSEWAYTYFYYSSYGYWFPSSYQSTYWGYYYYPYYYPWSTGYLKWDLDDPEFAVPDQAEILSYQLVQGRANLNTYRNYAGGSGTYLHNSRYYGLYAITEDWPSPPYSSGSYNYYSYSSSWSDSQKEAYIKGVLPEYRSTPEDRYYVPEYRGSSSYDYRYDINWDLSDLVQDWMDESLENNGVMLAMDETPYYSGLYHRSGYGTSSSNQNYYSYNYRGYFYGPGYSTSAYRPYLNIGYSLDSRNPWVDVGDDATREWNNPGEFSGTSYVTGWQNPINQYLRTHFPDEYDDYGNAFTYVPVRIGADLAGLISVSEIEVEYDYTATVYYNPDSGNIINELQSLVPTTEEGWSLIEINVTTQTPGVLKFDNLELKGTKPNYRPRAMEVPTIEVDEGIVRSDLLKVSDQFYDLDQDAQSLIYKLQKNDKADHVDLYLHEDEMGATWLGIDTSKDENWNGEVACQISATDEFGKDAWSNEFIIDVQPVNDLPYLAMGMEDIITNEGVDPILMEYDAPSGRGIANGKEVLTVGGGGEPYFSDIENEKIHIDFELLGPDMAPVNLDWSNEDRHKIYRGADNKIYLTILPPEYTDDPDNYIVLLGSDPDFYTDEGPYYLKVYASDDPSDLWNQTSVLLKIEIQAVNDPPSMLLIPDIVMDEDSSYLGTVDFVEEYIRDIDNNLEELTVNFKPSTDSVMASLNEEGRLVIDLEMDFNGVVPVTVEVSDGTNIMTGTFSVRIRSINDPPILIVKNLFDGQEIRDLYRVKGSADDIEKNLRSVEVAVVKVGETIYTDDWIRADGAYVWQHLLDTRELETGDYTVMVRAFDGRDFSDIMTYSIRIISMVDFNVTPPPKITITTPMLGDQAGTITVDGTVVDESGVVSFVEYRIDGGIWRKASLLSSTEWQVIIDTKTLKNEEHNFSVRGYDEKTYSDIVFRRFQVYNEDSDGDGIPNDIEVSLLMDPFNKLDGTMDFDSDTFSNQEELMVYNTDPFDGDSVPDVGEDEPLFDTWALIFIAAAILSAAVIIGLFILNIRLERNIHYWREDLNRKRTERKPKTLLQKIVEIAPTYVTGPAVPEGPALPGQPVADQSAALPPMPEGQVEQPTNPTG